jgi:Flp pilus assembly protein TadG
VTSKLFNSANGRSRHQRGTAMIITLGALVSLIAISSLAIDIGMVWAARNQLQNAADSAALAAGANLIDPDIPAVTASLATAAAVDVASQNGAIETTSIVLPVSDITLGDWDLQTRTFDSGVNLGDPDQVSAVQVDTRLDGVANGPVPSFFARILGRDGFDVRASATSYLGYAGTVGPGEIELPVAIDCCKLKGANCSQDYCATITSNPPNPCALASPQADGITTVSCLEFHATQDQNACWTSFSGTDPSVN